MVQMKRKESKHENNNIPGRLLILYTFCSIFSPYSSLDYVNNKSDCIQNFQVFLLIVDHRYPSFPWESTLLQRLGAL